MNERFVKAHTIYERKIEAGSAAKTTLPGRFVGLPRCARDHEGGGVKATDDIYFEPGIQPYESTTRVFTETGECLSLRM
jgi:hypothetical protein